MSHSTPRLQPAVRNGRRVLITPSGVPIGLLHRQADDGTAAPVPLAGAPVGTTLREHARHAEHQWVEAEQARRDTLAKLRRLQADMSPPDDAQNPLRGEVLIYGAVLLLVLLAVLTIVLYAELQGRPLLP